MKKHYGCAVLAIMLAAMFAGCASHKGQVYYVPVSPPAPQGTQQYTDQPATDAPPAQQYQEIVVDREIEVVYLDNLSKGDRVAGKMCAFEPNIWKSQVVVYNDSTQSYIPPADHPVWLWVQNIPTPNRLGHKEQPWYYKLFDRQVRIPVQPQTMIVAPPPIPAAQSAQKTTPTATMIIPVSTIPPAPAPKAAEQVAPPAQVSPAPAPATVYVVPPGYVKAETVKAAKKPRRVAPPPQPIDEAAYLKKLEELGYKGDCAVFTFQRKAGIHADGLIGPATAREIDRALRIKKDP